MLLDTRPGQVDVEEEEQRAESHNRRIELVMIAHESIVKEMTVDLGLRSRCVSHGCSTTQALQIGLHDIATNTPSPVTKHEINRSHEPAV